MVKLHHRPSAPEPPHKPVPFSGGLDKIPRRWHGWLMLFCLACALFYVVFGLYVKLNAPKAPYVPFVVTPKQVLLWQGQARDMLLVELGPGEQQPLLTGAIAVGPIASQPDELRLQTQGFVQSLPQPLPWIICYSAAPNHDIIRDFLQNLHELGVEHIYALSGSPRQWGELGLVYLPPEDSALP